MTGKDPEKMRRLPDTTGMTNEIIIQKCIRSFMYDRSMEVPGGKLVVVGEDTSCTEEQLEAAISDNTAAIHYLAGGSGPWWWAGKGGGPWPGKGVTPVPIEDVVTLGKRHNIPIIVDAAGQTWPLDGLTKFVSMGCDLVVYGGKYFLGPNSTGIVIGRKDLVEAVALHSFVGYESGPGITPGYYKGVGRGYKLDRQEIVGLVVALQKWASMDHDKERIQPAHARADFIVNALSDLPHLRTEMVPKRGEPIPYHRLSLLITLEQRTPTDVAEIKRELMEGDPSIWVDVRGTTLIINTLYLQHEDETIIADRLKTILTS
jgi:L-seryl-tRNA(Ser) seleniumtransferase